MAKFLKAAPIIRASRQPDFDGDATGLEARGTMTPSLSGAVRPVKPFDPRASESGIDGAGPSK